MRIPPAFTATKTEGGVADLAGDQGNNPGGFQWTRGHELVQISQQRQGCTTEVPVVEGHLVGCGSQRELLLQTHLETS